ncbi:hypothetical protein BDI4_280009 [Burkholderia diffusa]|nr:hypothetical protein BDI4_280009 [Burkholderia diffusa]
MTGYERFVHDVSIRRAGRAANRRALKSLSDIACEVSESADKNGRHAMCGAPIRCIRTDESQPASVA